MGCVCKTQKIQIIPNNTVNISVRNSIDNKKVNKSLIKLDKPSSNNNINNINNINNLNELEDSCGDMSNNKLTKQFQGQRNEESIIKSDREMDLATNNTKFNSKSAVVNGAKKPRERSLREILNDNIKKQQQSRLSNIHIQDINNNSSNLINNNSNNQSYFNNSIMKSSLENSPMLISSNNLTSKVNNNNNNKYIKDTHSHNEVLLLKENSKFAVNNNINNSNKRNETSDILLKNPKSFGNNTIINKIKSLKYTHTTQDNNNNKNNENRVSTPKTEFRFNNTNITKQIITTKSLLSRKPRDVMVKNTSRKHLNMAINSINQKTLFYFNLPLFLESIINNYFEVVLNISRKSSIFGYNPSLNPLYHSRVSSSNLRAKKNNPITIDFKATVCEQMFNCWCKGGTLLSFALEGKWSLDFSLPVISGDGYLGECSKGFPVGCLLGRISDEDNWFPIYNKASYTPKYDGFLILKLNCDPFYKKIFNPEGTASITIKDTEKLNGEQMQSKLGFVSANNFEKEMKLQDILLHNDFENAIIKYINEVRLNPRNFAVVYLKDFESSKDKAERSLYDLLTNNFEDTESVKEVNELNSFLNENTNYTAIKKQRKGLTPNKYLKHTSNSLCVHLEKIKKIRKLNENNETLNDRCKALNNPNLENAKKAETILITDKHTDSLGVVIELLLDNFNFNKMNRKYLIREDFAFIGVTSKPHYTIGTIIVINYSDKT